MVGPLAPDTPPELALRQIVAQCRDDLVKYRAAVLKSGRPSGIHQTRVALRRLRAAFTQFRHAAAGEAAQREIRALAGEARWLAKECAPARDLHVFLTETAGEVPPDVSRVARRLAKHHLERARSALAGARYSTFETVLAGFIDHVPVELGGRLDVFGRAVLDKRAGKVEKRGRKIASLDGKRLHLLRIAIKKLRYAAEFLRPAFAQSPFDSRRAKAYIEATARLQGALGALNDREVATQMVADIAQATRLSEDIETALARLRKKAASGEKRRRHKLLRAWKKFKQAERFWHDARGVGHASPEVTQRKVGSRV
jgi:CHAD domain-containing protein